MALEAGRGLGGWEIATAKKLVNEFRRKHPSLRREEFDDLLQECLVHWILARERVAAGPGTSPPVGYMAQVLRHRLTDIVRRLHADKRAGDPGAFSLEDPIDGHEDGLTWADVLEDVAGAESPGLDVRDARIDLARVLPSLTPAQQRLCRLLVEDGVSIKEAAERLRIPRGTLYEEIRRIRQVFLRHGLERYLRE